MAKKSETGEKPNVKVQAGTNIGHTLIWIVLLLVFVGLGGYGTIQFSGTVRSLGKVGDTDIPISRYQQQVRAQIQQVSQQTGLNLDMEQAKNFGLDRAALAQVIDQIALENEAARRGISVGDAEVQKRLAQINAFQDMNGRFDPAVYRATLKQANISVTEFEAQVRAEAARGLLSLAITQGVVMPPTLADTMYQWSGQRRSFVWAELGQSDLASPPATPTDADLHAWYDAHQDSYMRPEIRKITYAWLTPEMLSGKIDVNEDDLHKLYDSRQAEFNRPERRLVERLVFGTEDEAKQAWDQLQSGATTFEALVEGRGLTLDDVNMDEVTKEQLGPAGDAVFALKEPGVVGPVMTDLGPAIFRVNAILDAQTTPFDEVRDQLKSEFALDRARRRIQDLSEEVDDLLAGGATLEEVADETDLELGHIDWTADDSEGIAGYSAFRKAAAAAKKDDFSEAIGLDDGGIFALRLDDVVAPAVQPYDKVASQVAEDWKQDAQQTALDNYADELIPRIEAGEDPASFGVTVNRVDDVTRNTTLADTPSGLLEKVFTLDKGKAARIPGTDPAKTVALVQTIAINPPDPDNKQMLEARDRFAAQASSVLKQDVLDAFTRAVSSEAGVRIDQNVLEQVNAQLN